jgi:hypothetical protein
MVKRQQVRELLEKFGFEGLKERSNDPTFRLYFSAHHPKKDVHVLISANAGKRHDGGRFGKPPCKRHVKVEIMDKLAQPLPGVKSLVVVTRLNEIMKILEGAATGTFPRCVAA